MKREEVEVGKEYMAELWGKKARVIVTSVWKMGHSTMSGVRVQRWSFWVKKEDGSKTVVAASKLSKIK